MTYNNPRGRRHAVNDGKWCKGLNHQWPDGLLRTKHFADTCAQRFGADSRRVYDK